MEPNIDAQPSIKSKTSELQVIMKDRLLKI